MLRSALIAKLSSQKKKPSDKSPLRTPELKSKKKLSLGTPDNNLKQSNQKKKKVLSNLSKTPKVKRQESVITNFDEEIQELGDKFRISPIQVKKGLEGLISFTLQNPKLKNRLFDNEEFPVFLQVNSIKVPRGHPRIVRIPLKHSVLTSDSEVCLIVADVKGIPNKEHEKHLEHYEKILNQKGVDNIKKIMTFHEFRTEYETFELRSKLVELYDAFLVDGRISGKTVKKCGKIFYKKRKVPSAIKLQATKLKEHIEKTLKKTPLYLHSKGDSFMVQIGHSKMTVEELVENVFYIIKSLEREFPGGFGNIRSLNLFAYRGLTIPIYSTLKNQNVVDVSKNVKKSKPVDEVSGELTTKLNSGVSVKSTGEVSVFKLKNRNKKKKEDRNTATAINVENKRKGSNEDSSTPKKKIKVESGNNEEKQKNSGKNKTPVVKMSKLRDSVGSNKKNK